MTQIQEEMSEVPSAKELAWSVIPLMVQQVALPPIPTLNELAPLGMPRDLAKELKKLIDGGADTKDVIITLLQAIAESPFKKRLDGQTQRQIRIFYDEQQVDTDTIQAVQSVWQQWHDDPDWCDISNAMAPILEEPMFPEGPYPSSECLILTVIPYMVKKVSLPPVPTLNELAALGMPSDLAKELKELVNDGADSQNVAITLLKIVAESSSLRAEFDGQMRRQIRIFYEKQQVATRTTRAVRHVWQQWHANPSWSSLHRALIGPP